MLNKDEGRKKEKKKEKEKAKTRVDEVRRRMRFGQRLLLVFRSRVPFVVASSSITRCVLCLHLPCLLLLMSFLQ